MADPIFAGIEPTPIERLIVCLAIIGGGEQVPLKKLGKDLRAWKALYGEPTKESVEKWIDESFELRFALDCQINGEPRG